MAPNFDVSLSTISSSIIWAENTLEETEKIKGAFDSGYQGIQKLLTNAKIPYKKSKHHKLNEEEQEYQFNAINGL